jgi:hypothetical protein
LGNKKNVTILRSIVAVPDPHHFGKLDPDPHQSGKLDPDQDPHQVKSRIRLKVKKWKP